MLNNQKYSIDPDQILQIIFLGENCPKKENMKKKNVQNKKANSTFFQLHFWLSGGQLYISPMISSLLVIGKCSAEECLAFYKSSILDTPRSFFVRWLGVSALVMREQGQTGQLPKAQSPKSKPARRVASKESGLNRGQSYYTYISFSQEYLMGNPENLLKGKTALEKLWLTLKYIPMFSLTVFFRVGTAVPKVGSYKCRRTNHCLLHTR